ncbi:hypothetical protein QW71_35975 [Paenibacillus sp. IHB B 3415]|nr:hypothetical protein QW71_35975 [Paenibacillus sp. IHB B 3415]
MIDLFLLFSFLIGVRQYQFRKKIIFILNGFIKTEDNRFVNQEIRYKSKLEEGLREDNTALLAFSYLSLFNEIEVENYFLYYLMNIELGNDPLTEIVSEYFE